MDDDLAAGERKRVEELRRRWIEWQNDVNATAAMYER